MLKASAMHRCNLKILALPLIRTIMSKTMGNLSPLLPPGSILTLGENLQRVCFDIAITATETGSSGGGLSVAVVVAKLGTDTHSENSNSTVSRVQFDVVVDFPHQSTAPRKNGP